MATNNWLDEAKALLNNTTIRPHEEEAQWLRKVIAAAEDPHHGDHRTLDYRGLRVTVTLRDPELAWRTHTDPDTVLVFIDTDSRDEDGNEIPIPLSVQVNDSDLWEGLVPGTSNYDGLQAD